jgi:beta-glucosidase
VVPVSATEPFLFWIGDSSANLTLACDGLKNTCTDGRATPVV